MRPVWRSSRFRARWKSVVLVFIVVKEVVQVTTTTTVPLISSTCIRGVPARAKSDVCYRTAYTMPPPNFGPIPDHLWMNGPQFPKRERNACFHLEQLSRQSLCFAILLHQDARTESKGDRIQYEEKYSINHFPPAPATHNAASQGRQPRDPYIIQRLEPPYKPDSSFCTYPNLFRGFGNI
jgi:hypothetical protein